jgi:hypothetical protein
VAGGSIGLWVSIVVVAGLVLTGYLVYFLPPYGDLAQGCAPAGSSAGPPGCYFVTFFQVIMFLSIICATFLIFTFAVFGENGKGNKREGALTKEKEHLVSFQLTFFFFFFFFF